VESEHITIARPESLGKRALNEEFVYILAMEAEGGGQPWMSTFSVKSTKRNTPQNRTLWRPKRPGPQTRFSESDL
jgi:hypothetical protein